MNHTSTSHSATYLSRPPPPSSNSDDETLYSPPSVEILSRECSPWSLVLDYYCNSSQLFSFYWQIASSQDGSHLFTLHAVGIKK